jgi:hypothetical protein
LGAEDSAPAYKTLQNPEIEIACLLTSVNQQRISMHGVSNYCNNRPKALDYHLKSCKFRDATMEVYENVMRETLTKLKTKV